MDLLIFLHQIIHNTFENYYSKTQTMNFNYQSQIKASQIYWVIEHFCKHRNAVFSEELTAVKRCITVLCTEG